MHAAGDLGEGLALRRDRLLGLGFLLSARRAGIAEELEAAAADPVHELRAERVGERGDVPNGGLTLRGLCTIAWQSTSAASSGVSAGNRS